QLVPPLDVALAQPPAQPDLATAGERREVDQTRLDLAERDAQLVDPDDAGLHAVDDPLHPQPEDADVGIDLRLRGRVAPGAAAGLLLPAGREDLVAEADQLGSLVAQRFEDGPDLRDGGIRLVEVEESGHAESLARSRGTGGRLSRDPSCAWAEPTGRRHRQRRPRRSGKAQRTDLTIRRR